ncbi:DUF4416 family protein [candidate division WOR-3 bacterium]|nr:DUF4416 family protein [candidate division WOR-3 bacterium]
MEPKAKLFVGLIGKDEAILNQTVEKLIEIWGPIERKTELIPFDFSDYYEKEMGAPLHRQWVSFKTLINPADLPELKLKAIELEQRMAKEPGKRQVNIDPGYVTETQLVLASTKRAPHRIYMGKGIFVELTMLYSGGGFKPFRWTYIDYQKYDFFFNLIRRDLLAQIRDEG